MCMITYVPPGTEIPVEGITNGACANPDGHGWAVASVEHGIQVGKSMDKDTAIAEFTAARDAHGPTSTGLFHSRLGTCGEYGLFNVHPFFVPGTDEKTVMVHNGIFPKDWQPANKEERRSDTQIFVEETAVHYITERGVPSRRGGAKIGEAIGKGNKLVFLSVLNGSVVVRIVNSDQGTWDKGCWFSNTWYKQKRFGGGSWASSSWTGGSGRGAHSWWGDDGDDYAPYFGETWTQADEDAWQAAKKDARELNADRLPDVVADIDAALAASAAAKEEENPLDLPVITDVLEDYECDFCEARNSVHATTMTCLACKRCLDCMEETLRCTCFDWEAYLAKRNEEEALWVAGVREQMITAEA